MKNNIELAPLLPTGAENAKTGAELAAALNVTPATIKALVQDSRRKGVFICSSIHGYFLPADDSEKRSFLKMQLGQAKSRYETIEKLKG